MLLALLPFLPRQQFGLVSLYLLFFQTLSCWQTLKEGPPVGRLQSNRQHGENEAWSVLVKADWCSGIGVSHGQHAEALS
jgi:hypothetical protein